MKKITILLLLVSGKYYCQGLKKNIDPNLTSRGVYTSHEELCKKFLYSFLLLDSSSYRTFYSVEIVKLLWDEHLSQDSSEVTQDMRQMVFDDKRLFKTFANGFLYIRTSFFKKNGVIEPADIQILKIVKNSSEIIESTSYNYETYDFEIIFKNKKDEKEYHLELNDVFHINYNWFSFYPYFSISER